MPAEDDSFPLASVDSLLAEDTLVLLVDCQERLLPAIHEHQRLAWNIRRVLEAAQVFQIPVLATEQYPQGLGSTVEELRTYPEETFEKLSFSSVGAAGLLEKIDGADKHRLLVVGMETHVCVLQTVLDLQAQGYRVYIPVDAVGARSALDHDTALRRMDASGVTLTTTETTLFEWCRAAGTPEFKAIRQLVMQSPPGNS